MKTTITFLFILICGITAFAQTEAVPVRETNNTQATPETYSSVFDVKDFKKYYILSDPLEAVLKVLKKEKSIELTFDSTEAQFFIKFQTAKAGVEMRVFYIKDKKVVIVWAKDGEKGSEADLAEAFLEVLRRNKKLVQPINDSSLAGGASPDSKKIKSALLKGTALSLPKPVYPADARSESASGAVEVQVTINEQGNVIEAKAISGHPLLRAAAEDAARRATFTPTTLGGQPITVTATVIYNFLP